MTEGAGSRGGEKTPGPMRLGDILSRFLDRSGLGERLAAAAVIPEWDERVGDRIAAVARPLRTSGDVLLVGVRSSAWLMELKLMEREILARLNAGRERGRIRSIRFILAGEGAAESGTTGRQGGRT